MFKHRSLAVATLFFLGAGPATALAQSADPPTIQIDVEEAGRVSLAIYDEDGHVVRELLRAREADSGTRTVYWDGLDHEGKPAPAGQYTWKMLRVPGFETEYLMSLGASYPAGERWDAGAPGSHAAPHSVAVDETGIYIAARGTENIENYMLKLSPDGERRLWSAWTPEAWRGANSMALAGDKLYVLSNSGKIWVHDPNTGEHEHTIDALWPGNELDGTMGVPDLWQEPMDLDATDQFLIVAYYDHDAVRWLDRESGEVLHEVEIARPIGVTADGDDHALICSHDKVVRLNRQTSEAVTVIEALDTPTRTAIDPTDGTVLVSQLGETHQVVRYARSGEKVATYGNAGGRTHGLYTREQQESFLYVTDITPDGRGGFITAEPREAPRRVTHYDRDGALVNEWYGGQIWGPWVAPEPGNPSAVWMASGWFDIMRMEVDYDTKTWRVHSTYTMDGLASGLVDRKSHDHSLEVREHEGEIYITTNTHLRVFRVDRENRKLRPVAIEEPNFRGSGPEFLREWHDGTRSDRRVIWTDSNGDGQPQRDEMNYHNEGGFITHLLTSPALTHYAFTNVPGEPHTDSQQRLIAREPVEWNDAGAPVYPAQWREIGRLPEDIRFIEPRWGGKLAVDVEKREYYMGVNDRIQAWNTTASSTLIKMNDDGEVIWRVGERGTGPGQVDAFRHAIGFHRDAAMYVNFGGEWHRDRITPTYVWDRDGLWVGPLMDNPDLSSGRQWDYATGGEARSVNMHPAEDSDAIYVYACWLNEARVYRVSGWDGWQRDEGTVTLETAGEQDVPANDLLDPVTAPGEPGLICQFYRTPTPPEEDSGAEQVVSAVDLDWQAETPAETKSVRWRGQLWPEESGLHYVILSPGMRVWVDGRELTTYENAVNLTRGQSVPLRVEFAIERIGGGNPQNVRLRWVRPQHHYGDSELVPASAMRHAE
ncbi:MAG: FlgD immunoglobulin-like domain containing protein [Phycisphaeraceae bacterium]